MTGTYAANTTVTTEASRAEIERTLRRYGAQSFAYGWDQKGAMIEFGHQGRRIRFVLPLPDRTSEEFTHYTRGTTYKTKHRRTPEAAEKQWEQACRQRWRALSLCIKAKLEAVDAGISEFEDEFMANIVLPDNSTVGAFLRPQLAELYANSSGFGSMPALLPGVGE